MVTKHWADLPVLCGCFPLAICFTFGSVYMSMTLSHPVTSYPSPSPCPQVHSLVGLCLYSCLAIRFFMTFFFFMFILLIWKVCGSCLRVIGEINLHNKKKIKLRIWGVCYLPSPKFVGVWGSHSPEGSNSAPVHEKSPHTTGSCLLQARLWKHPPCLLIYSYSHRAILCVLGTEASSTSFWDFKVKNS